MATTENQRRYGALNLTVLLLILALACYVAALCFAEGWLTKGNWQEWIAGGLILSTLAKIV